MTIRDFCSMNLLIEGREIFIWEKYEGIVYGGLAEHIPQNLLDTELKYIDIRNGRLAFWIPENIPKGSIQELDFPMPLFNALKRREIYTLDQLAQKTDEELLSIRGIGCKHLEIIHERLQREIEENERDNDQKT